MMGRARAQTRGVERFFASPFLMLRIPPNAITLFSLAPAAVACGLAYQQKYLWALAAGLLAAGLDFVDGTVARERNQVSRFGGYLDSVVDRFVDFLFLFGIALGINEFRMWIASGAAMIGGFSTSYAKARAYEDVQAPKTAWGQLFERPERLLLLGVGGLAQGLFDWKGIDWPALYWTVVILAVGSLWTVVQRVIRVRELLAEQA